jgi:hypothetical protein
VVQPRDGERQEHGHVDGHVLEGEREAREAQRQVQQERDPARHEHVHQRHRQQEVPGPAVEPHPRVRRRRPPRSTPADLRDDAAGRVDDERDHDESDLDRGALVDAPKAPLRLVVRLLAPRCEHVVREMREQEQREDGAAQGLDADQPRIFRLFGHRRAALPRRG